MSIRQDIGPVSAYALAKEKGYQGTEEEFEQAMANVGTNIGEIKEAIDTFNDVTVPTATQSITNEGNTQVGLVNAAGTAQVEAVEEKGTIEIGAVEAAGTAQVGAVNSAGSTQVGNVNTAGSTQVNAVNGAGTTQVGNVNTAGGTQVAAVQAKGDEVIASIPEDYSDLTQEVSDLNQALIKSMGVNVYPDTVITDDYLISITTGQPVSASDYAITDYIEVNKNQIIAVACSGGNNVYPLALYDSNKDYIKSVQIGTGTIVKGPLFYIVEENVAYIRYNILKDTDFLRDNQYLCIFNTPEELENIKNNSTFNYFDSSNLKKDTLINESGQEVSFANYACTRFIPVNYGDEVHIAYANVNLFSAGAYYDETGTFIEMIPTTAAGSDMVFDVLPVNTKYIRINIQNFNLFPYSSQYIYINRRKYLYELINTIPNIFYVGSTRTGHNTFQTLKAVTEFIETNNIKNSIVYVDPETFDLVTEIGTTALDTKTTTSPSGLRIGNNTNFIFAEGSKVVFEYTGSNIYTANYFSPFNVYGSFKLENANIEVTNARYCVHEDIALLVGSFPDEFKGEYINCKMIHNGNSVGDYGGWQCIGGCSSKNGITVIDGGYYEALDAGWPWEIGYHNYNTGVHGDTPYKFILKNAYIENGIRFRMHSTSEITALVNGNSYDNDILVADDSGNLLTLKKWNNDIRS